MTLQVAPKVLEALELIYDLMQAEKGLAKIQVLWDGSGDDGQIEGFELLDKDDNWIEDSEFCSKQITDGENSNNIEDFLCEICYSILNTNFPGWEDNWGSRGTFVFSAEKRECTMIFGQKTIVENEHHF